jgi:hypothetical protein
MRITIEGSVVEKLENYTRNIISFLYSWLTTDGEVLGYILGVLHVVIGTTIPIMVVISNSIYPAFWFQCLSFGIVLLVWLQHVFLRVCIIVVAEKNFTKGGSPYFRIFKDTTGIDGEVIVDYLVVFETGALVGLAMGLLRQMSVFIYEFYGIEI